MTKSKGTRPESFEEYRGCYLSVIGHDRLGPIVTIRTQPVSCLGVGPVIGSCTSIEYAKSAIDGWREDDKRSK